MATVNKKHKPSPSSKQKKRVLELISLVTEIATAKGWVAKVASQDDKTWKYATVSVWRQAPGTHHEITGAYDITCDDVVRISLHQTSFYNWGLKDLHDSIQQHLEKVPWLPKKKVTAEKPKPDDLSLVERLLRRFHRFVRQLKHRYNDRPPLTIADEYDVQDLLHALLRGLFDDVRPEEYTPSYAGGASRMDFLLKAEQIVIEVKVASAMLRDRQIGEQLMIDIQRYTSHPDCKRLVCFIYDPGGFIKNPAGLEKDLSKRQGTVDARVIVWSA